MTTVCKKKNVCNRQLFETYNELEYHENAVKGKYLFYVQHPLIQNVDAAHFSSSLLAHNHVGEDFLLNLR